MGNISPRYRVPKEIRTIADVLRRKGRKTYIVGGALRDHFLGRGETNDIDLATDATPTEILELFPRVIPTGIKHGTVTILLRALQVEMTTLRVEKGYSDGRRPDSIDFVKDIAEDLSRRDFTMNAMALEVPSEEFFDPFSGRIDIGNKKIRSVGNAAARFTEDGLRPLRAIRFAAQLGFDIDDDTLSAIPPSIPTFRKVSAERIRDEFGKLLVSTRPASGLALLEATGLLSEILPELVPARGCLQKGLHAYDVLDHLFLAVQASPPDLGLRLAALFHDAGKPASMILGENDIPSFHGHEVISETLALRAMRRLRFPNDTIARVCHLIAQHMFHYGPEWTDAAVRRFIARAGVDSIEDLLYLRIADTAATAGTAPDPYSVEDFRNRIVSVKSKDSAFRIKDLAINGNDLAAIGFPRGPAMGRILNELLETVLDDPDQNTIEKLSNIATSLRDRLGLSNKI
ncbi:MAG: HD domain-containing protein [Spirochaetes bacterium]|nr:HD domain-containing protein [Spirochaetota bacterium]